ncbi:unnamed protein product [Urochloa humidicola]
MMDLVLSTRGSLQTFVVFDSRAEIAFMLVYFSPAHVKCRKPLILSVFVLSNEKKVEDCFSEADTPAWSSRGYLGQVDGDNMYMVASLKKTLQVPMSS